jgi:hypothetical protein
MLLKKSLVLFLQRLALYEDFLKFLMKHKILLHAARYTSYKAYADKDNKRDIY